MKGLGSSVSPLTAGVRSDIERLLQRFIDVPSVRFDHFVTCFNEINFGLIFKGRPSENEFREFCEKTLLIVLAFCFPPYSFQVNVGGAYLLYSLYYLQPAQLKMRIRATPEQIDQLKTLRNDLKVQQHFDACYVLCKLFRDQAFHVVAFPDEHNPLNYHRFDSREEVEKAVESLRNAETFITELNADERCIPHIELLHDRYVLIKKRLFEKKNIPEALELIDQNPIDAITGIINDCETILECNASKRKKLLGDKTEDIKMDEAAKRQKLKDSRSSVRQRAYESQVSKKKAIEVDLS